MTRRRKTTESWVQVSIRLPETEAELLDLAVETSQARGDPGSKNDFMRTAISDRVRAVFTR